MVPLPIALLSIFYGVVAALAAAMAWKIALGRLHQPIAWALVWLFCSGGAALGLAQLKPWGRKLAIWTSWLLILSTLAISGLLVVARRPGLGLAVTFSTACYYLMIRYLKRPGVIAWFGEEKPTRVGQV